MPKTQFTRLLSLIVCVVLIAAMALFTSGCANSKTTVPSPGTEAAQAEVLGEGATVFTFTVSDTEGKETAYEIHTDKTTVGEALLELGLITGEDGPYGLYIKTVNGITLDYDTDGMYWAFYVDGEYAMSGVDTTDIVAGSVYALKAEK